MRLFLLIILLLYHQPVGADAYRSKIILDPGQLLDENVSRTLSEIEEQLDGMTDSYAKSSTGRQLAHKYLKKKNYRKAAQFYEKALEAGGLSQLINQEMLKELAAVYLRVPDYQRTISTIARLELANLAADPGTLLILAQAYTKTANYLRVTELLDQLMQTQPVLNEQELRQVVALSYRSGNYQHCETILQQLIESHPDTGEYWRQLSSVYLAQHKQRAALDQLALAREKGLDFREQDLLLLVDLYATNKSPYKAAHLLETAILNNEITPSVESYKRLFNFWLEAREKEKAIQALEQATDLNGDIELYLYLAQLQMEFEHWAQMQQTVLRACDERLEDRFVGRTNLLLGISQLKLNERAAARRSFINATLISYNPKAGEWLNYMKAAPETPTEMRKITPPCRPKNASIKNWKGRIKGERKTWYQKFKEYIKGENSRVYGGESQ
jgi:tetratricopeptide (TPR) repeat protein